MVRPSKTFLFNYLEKKLKRVNAAIGLDAASANFKNRAMFKTQKYYGLDINLEHLKNGLQKYNDQNTFGILADLAKLEQLPQNSVDLIVSTNTLYALPPDKRLAAIDNLCRLAAPQAQFLCDLPLDKEFERIKKMLHTNFKQVKIIYYKNIFSQIYEKIFERNGFLGSHPVAGTRPFRFLAWLISLTEYLTCKLSFLNKHVLFVAKTKKDHPDKNQFNLSNIRKINPKIFDLT